MLRSTFCLVAGTFLGCILAVGADNSAAHSFKLYVGNSRGDDISIIDLASLKVTGEIKAGERVHGVCVQADGKRLFATVESDHTLRIIDTASMDRFMTEGSGYMGVGGKPQPTDGNPDTCRSPGDDGIRDRAQARPRFSIIGSPSTRYGRSLRAGLS